MKILNSLYLPYHSKLFLTIQKMKGKEKSDRTTPIGISKEKEYLLIKSATSIKDVPPKKIPKSNLYFLEFLPSLKCLV